MYINTHHHILHFQNWFLYVCSSVVLPPLLALCEEQSDSKTCDTEPLLSRDTTPVHTPSPARLVSASTNAGELLELRLDSISTISSWKTSSQTDSKSYGFHPLVMNISERLPLWLNSNISLCLSNAAGNKYINHADPWDCLLKLPAI